MLKREVYLSRSRGFYNLDLVKILVGMDFISTKTDEKIYFQVVYSFG